MNSINWQDVELEVVNESMKRQIVTGETMTVAKIYFEDGFVVPMHTTHNEQITQVVKGRMRFEFGGDEPPNRMSSNCGCMTARGVTGRYDGSTHQRTTTRRARHHD